MFSQLRLHGGSNHRFAPTAVLQRLLCDADPTSAFAGGVVRVEATNLSWVSNTFAEHIGPRGKSLLAAANVPAELFFTVKATTANLSVATGPTPRFYRHTLSALGLRRLVAQANALPEPFYLEYTRLRGPEGDERWRTSSPGLRVVLQGGGGGLPVQCAAVATDDEASGASRALEPCSPTEEALVAPESTATAWATFFLRPQPNPIVDGASDEMHCVTFG